MPGGDQRIGVAFAPAQHMREGHAAARHSGPLGGVWDDIRSMEDLAELMAGKIPAAAGMAQSKAFAVSKLGRHRRS